MGSIGGRCICGWKICRINKEVEEEEGKTIEMRRRENSKNCGGGGGK